MKHLLSILFLLSFSINLAAQDFRGGIALGIDLVDIHEVNVPKDFNPVLIPVISFNANVVFSFKMSNNLRFTLEPGYIQKGAFSDISTFTRIRMNYINMPLTFQYQPFSKLGFVVGQETAYLLSVRTTSGDRIKYYSKESLYDISLLAGISYEVKEDMLMGVRYNHSLTKYITASWVDQNGNELGKTDDYHQYLQVYLRFILF